MPHRGTSSKKKKKKRLAYLAFCLKPPAKSDNLFDLDVATTSMPFVTSQRGWYLELHCFNSSFLKSGASKQSKWKISGRLIDRTDG